MKKATFLISAFLIGLVISVDTQTTTASYGTTVTSLSTTGTGAVTGTTYAVPAQYAAMITWQVVANGSALSAILEGSNDNSAWSTVDTQIGPTGGIKNFGFTSLKFIRCSQVSRTGGTNTSCTIVVNRGFITSSAANLSTINPNRILFTDNGSATAPNLSWTGDSNTGIFKTVNPGIMSIAHIGATKLMLSQAMYRFSSGTSIGWSSALDPNSSNEDVSIVRSAAGILQVNGGAGGGVPGFQLNPSTFANLGTPSNGTIRYCSDCTIANPCASGGTGAFAKRLNGVWVCN